MPAPVHLITALIRISFIFWFSFLPFYGILLFLFTAGHSYPMLLSCRFSSVYVAMLQYNRICCAATYYRCVTVNSHLSAALAEIRVFILAFFLLQFGFLNLAFIPSEVFFRQITFVGVEAVIPHDAEVTQGNVLQQSGEELTIVQCQFLFYRISSVRRVQVVTIAE